MTAPKHDCIADDNIGCPACRVEGAPEISDWRRPDPTDEGCTGEGRGRGHTYTASEVKVLTETASKVAYALGRKDALDEALWAIEDLRADMPGIATDHGRGWNGCVIASGHVIRNLASQPSQAASDATSGVPGHPEVSEAVRSPQEPGEGS